MKFYLETYGCQMNVADSELVVSILESAGHEHVQDIDIAEVLLFNTCSVRAHAEERVLGRISNEQHRKKGNSSLRIGVLGCMAQRIGKELIDSKLSIDFVVGVDQYSQLPELLSTVQVQSSATDFNGTEVYEQYHPTHSNNTCGFITIMRGCNNFCSYCIVPYVRGRERSRSWRDIYSEIVVAGQQGLKDITLLGQNVNSYQDGDLNFASLLKKVNDIPEIYRIRFITSHPKDLSDELIEVIATCSKVCEHIHLPLQSGNDRILNKMRRGYTIEQYRELITKLRNAIPNIAITTDLIAGFPGETDAEFHDTLNAMDQIQFDYAFCFKYSNRAGTAAALYPDQLNEQERLKRLQAMINLQREITYRKFQTKIGSEVEVYVENFSKKSNSQVSGKTRDYKIAVLSGTANDIGKLVSTRVVAATAGTLICP